MVKKKLIPTGTKREDCVQTPIELANAIVNHFKPTGNILEPCKGDGNFLKALPKDTEWCEILENKDFFNFEKKVNWIITNPPYSIFRKFTNHSMEIADEIVFLITINHIWLKARLRDIDEKGFGIKEILLIDTPKTFPQSGFQFGIIHLSKNYIGDIKFSKLNSEEEVKTCSTKHDIPPNPKDSGILSNFT